MEPSSPRWLSDLVNDDLSISFLHQYESMIHSLEDYTLNDLNFQNRPVDIGSSTTRPSTTRPNSEISKKQLQKSPSISSSSKIIISFGGAEELLKLPKHEEFSSKDNNMSNYNSMVQSSNYSEDYQIELEGDYYNVGANNISSSSFGGQGNINYKGKQVSDNGQEHARAERKRREKINQHFIALSAVIPDLIKMDKATVLGEAAKYVTKLQERVEKLEAEVTKKTVESVVLVKKSKVLADDDESSPSNAASGVQTFDQDLPEIEARVSEKCVLIRVHCERRPGCTTKILNLIEKMNLSVLNNNVVSFGSSLLDITIVAQMEVEFSMTIDELVKNLHQGLMDFMRPS